MKTFLPVIAPSGNVWQTMRLSLEALDNKRLGKQRVESYQIWRTIVGLNKTKSWRTSPAIHMWRGYPDALGVYILINCQIWERRTSETTGKPFSNEKMNEHIQTYKFGRNPAGKLVFDMNTAMIEEAKSGKASKKKKKNGKATAEETDDSKIVLPAHDVAVAAAAMTEDEPAATAAAASSSPAAASDSPAAAAAASSDSPAAAGAHAPVTLRSGTYVDGIRIPWWWGDRRIHDSDAAILYSKDKSFYKTFKPQYKKYKEYVWPRDIDPKHPEQKEELDELQTILDAEEAEKEAKKAAKLEAKKKAKEAASASSEKKKKVPSKRKRKQETEADNDETEAVAAQSADDESDANTTRMTDTDSVNTSPLKPKRPAAKRRKADVAA